MEKKSRNFVEINFDDSKDQKKEESKNWCYICDHQFDNLDFHYANFHVKEEESISKVDDKHRIDEKVKVKSSILNQSVDENAEDQKLEEDYKCNLCGRSFSFRNNLVRHFKQLHQGLKRGDKVRVKCDFCKLTFATNYSLKIHVERKHDLINENTKSKASFPCNLCEKIYKEHSSLKRHMRDVHSTKNSDTKITCQFCMKPFSNLSLRKHIQSMHLGIHVESRKPIDCEICHKTFKRREILKKHIARKHERLNNFKCDFCEKTFNHSTNLKNHVKYSHEDNAKEKEKHKNWQKIRYQRGDYKCGLCDKNLKTSMAFSEHKNLFHNKLTRCDLCNKGFRSQSQLKAHFQRGHKENDPLDTSVLFTGSAGQDPLHLQIKKEPHEFAFESELKQEIKEEDKK